MSFGLVVAIQLLPLIAPFHAVKSPFGLLRASSQTEKSWQFNQAVKLTP
jgi:hypothetical protein